MELGRGADGAMTGVAYPEMLVGVCEKYFAGDIPGCRERLRRLPADRALRETSPGSASPSARKSCAAAASPRLRRCARPAPRLDADDHKELDNLMARLDEKLAALTMPFPARLRRAG